MAEYGEPLSDRELEVLELLTTGATNRQIAQDLVVSVNTVKVHLRNIYTKMGVESRTEATLIAIRDGLVSVPTPDAETSEQESDTESIYPASYQDAGPALDEGENFQVSEPIETLPPLPVTKRLALIASLILVILGSIATWPRSQTAAIPTDPDTDSAVISSANGELGTIGTEWQMIAPMITGRSRFALVATANGALFAIGGETNGGVTGSVERYDPAFNQWEVLSTSKRTRVSNIGGALIRDSIYVPGGRTADGEPTSVVEALSLADERWREVRPLPRPLYTYALAVYQNEIYLFGGRDNQGYSQVTLIYNPQQDTWREGRAMPTQRAYAAAAVLGSQIYVVGGYDGRHEQAVCEVYSPAQDSWGSCEPLTQARGGLGLAGVANRLYAVGGGWSNYLGFSEVYNPQAAEWLPFETPVSQQWHNLSVASTLSKFYVAGGWRGEYLNGVWEYTVLPFEIYIP